MLQLNWNAAISTLREALSQTQFQNWVQPVEFLRCNERAVVLGVPSRFHEEWVKTHYGQHIRQAIRRQCGTDLQLEFEILVPSSEEPKREGTARPALRLVETLPSPEKEKEPEPTPSTQSDGPPLPVFQTPFLELEYNRMAYQLGGIFSQSENPVFQVLLVQAGVGMGKTHLLSQLGHWYCERFPAKTVRYVSAESFGADYVRALKTNGLAEFKRLYAQSTDCLLFDDIHSLAGREKFQEALLHIFNEIIHRGGRIAFSSTVAAHRIPDLIEPLRSRLVAGVIGEIRSMTSDERVQLLSKICEMNRIFVEGPVLRSLADKGQRDVRELIGTLLRIHLQSRLENRTLDTSFVGEATIETPKGQTTLSEIIALVEHNFGICREELVSKSRKEGPTWARQVAMYLARSFTLLSLQEIGKGFGRDHATVLHAYQKVVDAMAAHPQKRYQVEFLKKKLQDR